MQKLNFILAFLSLVTLEGRAQKMPEIVALINSSIDSGQEFQCDDSGWVRYKKVNYVGSDYQSLLFFEFDLKDVDLIYAHNHYVFLENHNKYWIYVSHHYTDKLHYSEPIKSSQDRDLLTSAALTIDLKPGIDPEHIIEALRLLRDY